VLIIAIVLARKLKSEYLYILYLRHSSKRK
jgi:hypothetical protein